MRTILALLAIVLLSPVSWAEGELEVQMPGGEKKTLTKAELAALPQIEISRPARDQPARIYAGPALEAVLLKCGVALGGNHKQSEGLRSAILASGVDGYAVALSANEVDSSISAARTIVAVTRDGMALPDDEGPLRLIVEKDVRPVRSVKNLVKIVLSDLGKSESGK